MQFTDTAAIVTGGASGLGLATGRALAARGTRVFALDLAKAVAAAPQVDGIRYVEGDVTDPDQVGSAVAQASGSGVPLRIAVNCAGIGVAARTVGKSGPHELATFQTVVQVNLVGTFNVLRLAAAAMGETAPDEQGQRGVVVNTASIAAFEGQIGQVAYAASKGGVVSLTLPAARDLSSIGVRVCTIAPGTVDTPMLGELSAEVRDGLAAGIPFPKRLGDPEDYARLATMIVEHDYLNGETIRMDGALRMPPR